MRKEEKDKIIRVVTKIIVAVIGGFLIGWISKINIEAGLELYTVIGIASGLVILLS